jgi:hypothetical protein
LPLPPSAGQRERVIGDRIGVEREQSIQQYPSGKYKDRSRDWIAAFVFLELYKNVFAFDFDLIYVKPSVRLRRPFAGLRIKAPAVPRTHNLAFGDHTLSERTSPVETDVVHGMDFTVHIGDAKHSS